MGRVEFPELIVLDGEPAAGGLAPPDEEGAGRIRADAALFGPRGGGRMEIVEGEVALIVGAADPLLVRAGQGLLKGCDRHGFSLPGCAGRWCCSGLWSGVR
jgi:hypothetical protein